MDLQIGYTCRTRMRVIFFMICFLGRSMFLFEMLVPMYTASSYISSCVKFVLMYLLVHSFEQRQFFYFVMYITSFQLSSCLYLCMHVVKYRETLTYWEHTIQYFINCICTSLLHFFATDRHIWKTHGLICDWVVSSMSSLLRLNMTFSFGRGSSSSFWLVQGGTAAPCHSKFRIVSPQVQDWGTSSTPLPPFEMSSLTCSTTHLRTPEVDRI